MTQYAYPVVGGPLDGQYAATSDFDRGSPAREGRYPAPAVPPGKHGALADDYRQFNGAREQARTKGTSMIWLHRSYFSMPKRTANSLQQASTP